MSFYYQPNGASMAYCYVQDVEYTAMPSRLLFVIALSKMSGVFQHSIDSSDISSSVLVLDVASLS